jgi:hypothetical protein
MTGQQVELLLKALREGPHGEAFNLLADALEAEFDRGREHTAEAEYLAG